MKTKRIRRRLTTNHSLVNDVRKKIGTEDFKVLAEAMKACSNRRERKLARTWMTHYNLTMFEVQAMQNRYFIYD